MNGRDILAVLLVAALVVPAASATVMQPQSPASQSAAPAEDSSQASNYTRLYVEDGYRHLELKPGQSDSFTVTVENGEEEAVTVNPHLYLPKVGDRPVEKSWVTISASEATLEAGEERTFTVNVSVPEGTELASYRGMVAFTDETITYPGQPPRPVHATDFSVRVYKEPTVTIVDGEYMHTQIQAGESYTHSIVIENSGEQAVPVDPEVLTERERYVVVGGSDQEEFQRSWVDIEAPNEIAAGSTATVNVTISPPASADVGDYNVNLDLGLKDPARDDRNDWWQRVNLGFQVWQQPEEPFTTTFSVSEETTELTLTLNSQDYRRTNAGSASFDVSFVTPDGEVVEAERVRTTNTGYVDLAGNERASDDAGYASHGGQKTFTYRVEEPAAGEWTARIMPENTIRFGYEVVREES